MSTRVLDTPRIGGDHGPRPVARVRSARRSREGRATLGSIVMLCGSAVSFLVALAVVPLTVGHLGTERLGLLLTSLAMVALLEPLDFGVGNALVTLLPRHAATGDRTGEARLVMSGLRRLIGVAAALLALAVVTIGRVDWAGVLGVHSPDAIAVVRPTMIVLAAATAIGLPLALVDRVNLAYQDAHLVGLTTLVGNVLSLVLVVAGALAHADVPVLAAAMAAGPIAVRLIMMVNLLRRRRPWLWQPRLAPGSDARRELWRTGGLFFGLQLAVAVAFTSDQIVVAHVLGAEAVPSYAVPARVFGLVSATLFVILRPLWPAYADAAARGDAVWLQRTLRRSTLATAAVAAVLVIPLWAVGPWAVHLLGRDAVAVSRSTLAAFALWTVLSATGAAVSMALNGLGVMRLQLIASALMAGLNLALSWVLAQHVGVVGVVWGSVATYTACIALPYVVLVPRALHRAFAEASP
jgi:O-antigen/teichoic acid export membrane protein